MAMESSAGQCRPKCEVRGRDKNRTQTLGPPCCRLPPPGKRSQHARRPVVVTGAPGIPSRASVTAHSTYRNEPTTSSAGCQGLFIGGICRGLELCGAIPQSEIPISSLRSFTRELVSQQQGRPTPRLQREKTGGATAPWDSPLALAPAPIRSITADPPAPKPRRNEWAHRLPLPMKACSPCASQRAGFLSPWRCCWVGASAKGGPPWHRSPCSLLPGQSHLQVLPVNVCQSPVGQVPPPNRSSPSHDLRP